MSQKDIKQNPSVSVVMPVLNGEKYLSSSIKSVLEQTFRDFELIIINDGSTDKTEQIIKSFNDPRIIYIKNDGNKGLAISFNIGINASNGKFIARMDADDICEKARFEKQLNFLESNPSVGIVGSSVIMIDEEGKKIKVLKREISHINIKWSSLFSTPMFHPSVMGKTEIFKNNLYDEDFKNSEDYELWSRLLFSTNIIFANIKEPLLRYRVFPNSFTQTLNLDKRVISAHNTINNIKHYTELSMKAEKALIRIRQERLVSLPRLFIVWIAYLKAARAFCSKENLGFKESLFIYRKLISLAYFLMKFIIKELYHIFR